MRVAARTQGIGLLIFGLVIATEILLALLVSMHYKLAFLISGGILILAIAFVKMEWTAPTLVFSLFVMGVSLGGVTESMGGNIRVFHLIAAFLIIRWTYYAMITDQPHLIAQSSIVAPSLFILGWATLSMMWAPDLRFALYRLVKLGLSIGGALVFISIIKHKKMDRYVIWFWVLSGAAGGAIAYYSWFAAQGVGETWVSHQNIVSAMMNVVIFLSLGMAILTRKALIRWFSILTVIFALAVNANTGCRGGVIGLAAGIMIFAILGVFNSKVGRKFPIILTTILVISIGFAGYTVSRLESLVLFASGRALDIMNPMQSETFAWRVDTFKTAFQIMYEYSAWVWGMGIGAWEYLQDIYMQYTWARFIHNFYINFFFQYGIIGIGLLIWLFIRIFAPIIRTYKLFKDSRNRWFLNCLIALYVCMAVHGMVSIEEVNSYIWMLFATTSIFIEYMRDQHEQGLPVLS
jgi:O-antigen ligase